jgi:drug/metabolite transporter (DMT)-like permease
MSLQPYRIPILIVTFCLLWSSAFAAAKVALIDCPPLQLITARFLLAGGLTLIVAAARPGAWHISWRDLGVLVVLGLANNALYLGLNQLAMTTIAAGLAALIASANPVLTAVLASAFLAEPMTWRKATGLGLGVLGVAIIVQHRIAIGADAPIGVTFAVAALTALVAGTILFKRLKPSAGLWIGTGIQNLVAGVAVAPFAFTFESVSDVVPTWRLLWALGFLVLFVSILAYVIWFHLLTVIGPSAASAYHFLMPPLGVFFGWLLLGEHIELRDLVGILPITVGIYFVTRLAGPPRRPQQQTVGALPAILHVPVAPDAPMRDV